MGTYAVSTAVPADTINFGNKKGLMCRITGAGTYTANGDVIDPAWFGMEKVDYIIFQQSDTGPANSPLFYKLSGVPRIFLRVISGDAEFSGTNASVFDVIVIGV